MKSSVNKGFITYLLLFLGVLVGVVLVCCTIMMFSPGTEILGYVYYNSSAKTVIENYNGLDRVTGNGQETVLKNGAGEVVAPAETPAHVAFGSLAKIVVKTNSINVNFIHGPEDRIDVVTNLSGFNKVSEDQIEFVVTKQYDADTNTLTITAYNPSLLLTIHNNCAINVIIQNQTPVLMAEVETTSAPITFAVQEFSNQITKDLTLSSLTATSEKGAITISTAGKIRTVLDLSVDKANIDINGSLGASEGTKLTRIKLHAGEGNIKFSTLFANTVYLSGETTFVNGTNIYAGIGGVQTDIVRGNIELENIYGFFTGTEEMKGTRIKIKHVSGSFTLPQSQTGDIFLDEVLGIVYIKSTTGSVQIKDANNATDIETTTGSIKILIEGDYNTLLKTTSGTVNALYRTVLKSNTITTESGVVNVFYNETGTFKFEATTTKTVNLIAENQTFENQTVTGYPKQTDTEFETVNILKITSQANINVDVAQTIAWELFN